MAYNYERVTLPSTGLRLHLNENTAGCSPRVLQALHALTREQAAFYPDYADAIAACAARFGVATDNVLLTNGLDEGILALAVSSLRRDSGVAAEAIVVAPAFDMYAACADVAGGRVVEVRAGADLHFPRDAVLAAITERTRLVFLTTPNNPTGESIDADTVFAIADAAPMATIFVDEAYVDFADGSILRAPGLKRYPQIVIGRTFAKAYGLAALRAGALVGASRTLTPIRRVVPPYSVNVCAAVALCAAVADLDYYEWYVSEVRASRELLYRMLDRLGIRYWRSEANFVLADFGSSAARVLAGLAERQVYVRDRSRDPICPSCVRITAGVVEHTRQCIAALEEVLCAGPS